MYSDYYNYGQTTAAATSIFAGAIIFLVILGIIAFAAAIVYLIALMKVFKKAGKPAWGAFVPGYDAVLQCEIAGVDPRWVVIVVWSSLASIIPFVGWLATAAACIYYMIIVNIGVARAFGKSDGFAVGLILLPIVFYPILGFGSAKFVKTTPMNDIFFNKKK